ncbi:MAG: hypothetical protein M3Z04_18030, partial [Chloroflexota bacterium]|nr:hypothetical protein [Chloroflexota bacterium]
MSPESVPMLAIWPAMPVRVGQQVRPRWVVNANGSGPSAWVNPARSRNSSTLRVSAWRTRACAAASA